MKLQHQSEVAAGLVDVWAVLQDTRAVVECLPGAELVDDLGGDRYQGLIRVAVGPLKMQYAGEVSVIERDADEHRIVLDASGRDKRGSGAVTAHVQLHVTKSDAGSRIEVVSDLDLSGRIASLGRGVGDVSSRMFVEFADRLEQQVDHPGQRTVTPELSATRRVPAGEIKVMALVWGVTRERIADLLERASARVRPG